MGFKKILTLILACALSSCYTTKINTEYLPSNQIKQISYEESSANVIRKSIENLNILKILEPHISKQDRIIITSIDKFETLDKPLIATIEDIIIKKLVTGGYAILERDKHTLYKLNKELDNFNYKVNDTMNYRYKDSSSVINQGLASKASQLKPATKLISYRIVETGLLYHKKPSDHHFYDREARTILEVRLINVLTGQILTASTVSGQFLDQVAKRDIQSLNNFHYKFYKSTFPKSFKSTIDDTVIFSETPDLEEPSLAEKPDSKKSSPFSWLAAIPASIPIILFVLGFFG